jgi:predicted Zn-dependent protease
MTRFLRLIGLIALLAGAPALHAEQGSEALAIRAREGEAAMQASRFDEAAAIYAELVAAKPRDGGLLMNLGMARYMAGHPADAVAPLRKAVQLTPALAPASLFLGASLLDLGRPQEAVPSLQKAVTAMPGNADAREMLARGLLMLSRFSSAAVSYRALTGLQPENPKGWYGIAKSYEGLTEELLASLQQQAPDSPLLELLVADLAVTQDKFGAALGIYRRVLADPPVGGLHEAVADLYDRAGKSDWAIAERRKAEATPPARCAARPGECEFLGGRFREAVAVGVRAAATPASRYWAIRAANRLATDAVAHLETLPPSIELHLIRAEIAQSRGQYPDAVREVRGALALASDNPVIETALAEALLRAHDLNQALPLLERLTRSSPDDPALLLMYGDGLVEHQELDRAIPVLEAAVKADRTRLAAHASLGRAYVQAGRFAEAVPHLEAAVAEDGDGSLHYQLARAYQSLQRQADAQKAMAVYQQRLKQAPPPSTEAGGDEVLTPPERE